MSQCLITGCELWGPNTSHVHGDLHREGESYIFNAVLNDTGDAAWQFGPREERRRALVILDGAPYFERRGIIVIDVLNADLNTAAREYLS